MTLKERREALGLYQRDLAEQLGVTQSAIHKWEHGKAYPKVAHLRAMAVLFHCPMTELIDDLYRQEAG